MASDLIQFKPTLPTRERSQVSGEEVRAKYRQFKQQPVPKVLLSLDGTGSMAPYWNEVAHTIGEITQRIFAVGGEVMVKIVAYRDHCDGPRILEASPWSTTADELRRFVGSIVCDGGGDTPEAVDQALQVALQEQEPHRLCRSYPRDVDRS